MEHKKASRKIKQRKQQYSIQMYYMLEARQHKATLVWLSAMQKDSTGMKRELYLILNKHRN